VSRRPAIFLLALFTAIAIVKPLLAQEAQNEEFMRRAKVRVQPAYPELARKMNITGTVKVEVVVLPNGVVKEARVMGGHPVLASAAVDAAKKWRFEPAPAESTGVIDFKFEQK
jgi:TonB family protein